MKKVLLLLVLIFIISILAAGCGPAPEKPADPPTAPADTPTSVPATPTPDPTRPEVVETTFTVGLEDGSLEVHLASHDSGADYASLEVRAIPLGEVALVRVEDPAGAYAIHTELVAAEEGEEDQGVWLSEMDSFQGDVQLLRLPEIDTSGLTLVESTTSQAFLENTVGGLDAEDWYTLFIELDSSGGLPDQVEVYALPFENAWLLLSVEQTSLLDRIFRAAPAYAASPYEMGWNFIRNEGQRQMMDAIAESRGTQFGVPELIADIDKLGVQINLNHDYYDGNYQLIGLECNNRALAELMIELSREGASYWVTNQRDFRTRITVASSPQIGDPWYEVAWDASLGVIASRYIDGVILKIWYCQSVIEDVDMEEPVEECSGEDCKTLTIENPQSTEDSITLVGPQLYQFDIPPGTSTFALESGTYNFAITMCNGDWVSNGTLDPEHLWLIGMPDSCTW